MTLENTTRKYQRIAELGHGGSGLVYLAVTSGPAGFQKLQVVKQLKDDQAKEPALVQMFLQEAKLSARLNHPNIVQINEVGEAGGRYFMAMEYLDGQSLDKIIRRADALGARNSETTSMLLRVLSRALSGLQYAHSLRDFDGTPFSIVHRDVSPHNIVVTYDGHVKVLDFGIAKVAGYTVHTETGVVKGKVRYMPPEQAAPDADPDARADIFAMGVILFEVLTGTRYWAGLSDSAILISLIRGDVRTSPREVVPDLDPELDRICARALAPSVADRYATAADMQRDINAYLGRVESQDLDQKISLTLESWFSEEKKKMSALINSQLQLLDHDQSDNSLVEIPVWGNESSDSGRSRRDEMAARGGLTAQGLTSTPEAQRVAPKKPLTAFLLVAASVAVLALVVLRSREASLPPAAAAPAPSSLSHPAPALMELRVDVEPAGAAVFVDDAQIFERPVRARFPVDQVTHVVRVENAGFASRKQTVSFERDTALTIRLDALAPAASASASAPPPRGTKTGVRASTPRTEAKKGIHAFDGADPFGK